jgi:copper chaperone
MQLKGETIMLSKTFNVPNISCGHCVKTIEMEVGDLEGISSVKADERTRMVTVEWNEPPLTWSDIEGLLIEIDYPPAA